MDSNSFTNKRFISYVQADIRSHFVRSNIAAASSYCAVAAAAADECWACGDSSASAAVAAADWACNSAAVGPAGHYWGWDPVGKAPRVAGSAVGSVAEMAGCHRGAASPWLARFAAKPDQCTDL
jgi:hypothetical protein